MKRNEFLKVLGAGVLIVAVGILWSGCKSSTTPTPSTSDTKDFISTSVADSTGSNHNHTVTVKKSECQTPPAAGISRETTSANGHTHAFTMTSAQLTQVNNGTPVEVTTTGGPDTHQHVFHVLAWYW
jgi:hypothetical protein